MFNNGLSVIVDMIYCIYCNEIQTVPSLKWVYYVQLFTVLNGSNNSRFNATLYSKLWV